MSAPAEHPDNFDWTIGEYAATEAYLMNAKRLGNLPGIREATGHLALFGEQHPEVGAKLAEDYYLDVA